MGSPIKGRKKETCVKTTTVLQNFSGVNTIDKNHQHSILFWNTICGLRFFSEFLKKLRIAIEVRNGMQILVACTCFRIPELTYDDFCSQIP
jgi:hypothetical protein